MSVLMSTFMVTMRDKENARGWINLDTGEPTNEMSWTVEAADEDSAKAFAEEHNPGLEAVEAKEVE